MKTENRYNIIKAKYEFHILGNIRKQYKFSDELFSIKGNVIFANFSSVSEFTHKLNSAKSGNERIFPSEINAMGLLDEIFHYIFRIYEEEINTGVFNKLFSHLNSEIGESNIHSLLFNFIEKFPPSDVFKGQLSTIEYLQNYSGSKSNYEIALEELILLFFDNLNPAGKKLIELFDESSLENQKIYKNTIKSIESFFLKEPTIGNDNLDLISFLKSPLIKYPGSLIEQLEYIRTNWGLLLDAKFMKQIMQSKDFSKEEIFLGQFNPGDIPTIVPSFKGDAKESFKFALGKSGYNYVEESKHDYEEHEKFTPDIDWMPNVVLMAKNIYVWLNQLSKKYNRDISLLNQIPDEEIQELSDWGFNGLWLIGIWERSSASKKIKHILGNIDSVASAYSLYDYHIASDLGGDAAYENFHHRCNEKGIRLASDMVPNHTGIYSQWIVNHPEYFIQTHESPFPNYSFTGEDLSDDPNIEIKIEDGYWNHSDAAVVFRRYDKRNNSTSYIYHGNDGTVMPWNDTAQLNLLKKEVREAVIGKIFEVARKFSIIRFDAAMTLAKRHFSRLWYPEPGKGGDISSRSNFSMTKKEFDNYFPVEFWREVVDRINSELPNTLLLAEAFWMMEGYFVRTLGMHRVYNSAFMHMLMKEENNKYRELITNTLEFEPEILKRYVNFMSNPDEETAIHQFGTDDKYFGVATLMVTLPGLPMFAHGQIEGYTEKYGMEYKRAYYDEVPKQWLVDRHKREIFPLLKKRFLFSEIRNFWIYDFFENDFLNENVFAYTNTSYGEKALVFYNNCYKRTNGFIKISTLKSVGINKNLEKVNLADALELKKEENYFYVFKENHSGLEYIRSGFEIYQNGFYIELNGFEARVFIDFKEVYDDNGIYSQLSDELKGSGVEFIDKAIKRMEYKPIHNALMSVLKADSIKSVTKFITKSNKEDYGSLLQSFCNDFELMLNEIKHHFNINTETIKAAAKFENKILASRLINILIGQNNLFSTKEINVLKDYSLSHYGNYRENVLFFILFNCIVGIEELFENEKAELRENIFSKLFLEEIFITILKRLGRSENELYEGLTFVNVLLFINAEINKMNLHSLQKEECDDEPKPVFHKLIKKLFKNEFARSYLNINLHDEIWYFRKERFETVLDWIFTLNIIHISLNKNNIIQLFSEYDSVRKNDFTKGENTSSKNGTLKKNGEQFNSLKAEIIERLKLISELKSLAKDSHYKLAKMIKLLD